MFDLELLCDCCVTHTHSLYHTNYTSLTFIQTHSQSSFKAHLLTVHTPLTFTLKHTHTLMYTPLTFSHTHTLSISI